MEENRREFFLVDPSQDLKFLDIETRSLFRQGFPPLVGYYVEHRGIQFQPSQWKATTVYKSLRAIENGLTRLDTENPVPNLFGSEENSEHPAHRIAPFFVLIPCVDFDLSLAIKIRN